MLYNQYTACKLSQARYSAQKVQLPKGTVGKVFH